MLQKNGIISEDSPNKCAHQESIWVDSLAGSGGKQLFSPNFFNCLSLEGQSSANVAKKQISVDTTSVITKF